MKKNTRSRVASYYVIPPPVVLEFRREWVTALTPDRIIWDVELSPL